MPETTKYAARKSMETIPAITRSRPTYLAVLALLLMPSMMLMCYPLPTVISAN
jgi:hypothetical protein